MLLPASSPWLPLQPLPGPATYGGSPLPASACSIEALREAFLSFDPVSEPQCTFRLANTRDVSAMTNLHSQCLPLHYAPAFFLPILLDPAFICLVAVSKLGMTGCLTAYLDVQTSTLQILTLCILPCARRQGLATQLLRKLAEHVPPHHQEPSRVALDVQVTNDAAVSLYRRLGFRIVGRTEKHYRAASQGGASAFHMLKLL